MLPERRLAGRGGQIPGNADLACDATREVRESRLVEYRRRLLRHDRTTHPSDSADGRGQETARPVGRIAPRRVFGHRDDRSGRKHEATTGWRTHECHRIATV